MGIPRKYWEYHHKNCSTMHRGCDPECPKDVFEKTGKWTGEDIPRFLVIGDIMIDRYTVGEVKRLSPEAPVQIVDVKYQYDVLGGAANCARNIATLTGKDTVDILGYFDPMDDAGKVVQELLFKEGIYFNLMTTNYAKPTTIKERFFACNQQLLRVDTENKEDVFFDDKPEHDFFIKLNLEQYDYIIISDYAKGVVTNNLMNYLSSYRDKIIIDPKPENWGKYPSGPLLVTPNIHEHNKMLYPQPFDPQHILVTKGQDGMTLHTKTSDRSQEVQDIKSNLVQNSEVIGAGDTVSAIMAVCLQMGFTMYACAKIANECAGYVVSQPGTAIVPKNVFARIVHPYQIWEKWKR
jgi:D-beta-D-heptose 7-phosphate kinase/D-beta-D-heptose 1-phosphate adenosyltransferase